MLQYSLENFLIIFVVVTLFTYGNSLNMFRTIKVTISRYVDMLCVVLSFGDRNWENWKLLIKERIAKITKLRNLFYLEGFNDFFKFYNFWSFGVLSLWTSLLCIVGELAEGRSVDGAVGVGDRGQVTCDTWHVTHDMWKGELLFSSVGLVK